MKSNSNIKIQWHKSINEIPEKDWMNLIIGDRNPFFAWQWLDALEKSESICPQFGWLPIHLVASKEGRTIGVAPLYLKSHSYGEFIFDKVFVDLSLDLGLQYYPKLIGMSPLSPVEGYRFFISPEEDESEVNEAMLKAIDDFAISKNILSCNFLYTDPNWVSFAEKQEYITWINQQSMWTSEGEKDFSDYLARFNANQRRNIKRERKNVAKSGIKISTMENEDIDRELLILMYRLYEEHCLKWGIWGSKYLSEKFFQELNNISQKNQIVLFSAHRGNPRNPIGMSMCLKSQEMLWGRYWGSKEDIDCLHFEVCYYSPIEWAIENNIKKFDPGAGGMHKKRRGFEATPRLSLHKWYNKQMYEILKYSMPRINQHSTLQINASNNEVPFRSKQQEL